MFDEGKVCMNSTAVDKEFLSLVIIIYYFFVDIKHIASYVRKLAVPSWIFSLKAELLDPLGKLLNITLMGPLYIKTEKMLIG